MAEDRPLSGPTEPLKPDTGRAGIVLAGGESARFPTIDKALAPLSGTPLLAHAVETLVPIVDELFVSCRYRQVEEFESVLSDFDVRFIPDRISGRGPVFGLRDTLSETAAAYAALLPCDMPYVPTAFVETLFSRARNHTGALAQVDGQAQPFPAAIHVRAGQNACTTAIRSGDPSLPRFIDELEPIVIPEPEVFAHVPDRAFTNINTPDDLLDQQKRPQ